MRIPTISKNHKMPERNKNLENGPYLSVPGIVLLEGGLPIITKDGQHIGAIGISGATPELDGICQNEIAIGTFNLSIEPRDYYYEEIWSNPGAKAVYLGHLGIDPTIQSKGLGTWCMRQIERIAQEMESKAIRFDALNIHPWLKAFYEKLGYSPRTVVKPKQWELLCFEKILCK